jgi:hypothetical protein
MMGTSGLARRLLASGALGIGVVVAPILGPAFAPTPTNVAAPGCTVVQTSGSASLVCPPGSSGTGGAPSEQGLTSQNNQPGPPRRGLLGLGGIL